VIDPFDRFGDHLRLALRSPSSYQLLQWLEAGPGAELPPRGESPTGGRWVVCGYGRFGRHLTGDLRAEGLDVTVIEPVAVSEQDASIVVGDGSEASVMALADLETAVGFVAATDNDTTNVSVIAAARRINPALFVAARQNQPSSASLFAAMQVDSLLVPTEVIAHEVYAQLSTPLLWRFLQEMPAQGDDWAAQVIGRLTEQCSTHLQALWKVKLNDAEAPALGRWLPRGDVRLGDLMRNPEDRNQRLHAVPLLVLRDSACVLTPGDDFVLAAEDQMLLAGRPSARRALETTLMIDARPEYVIFGRHVPSSWIWRRFTRHATSTS
jgi:hypothetical protein